MALPGPLAPDALEFHAMPNTTHRAVAHMTGSLPMGGQVMNTPVFAFHHTPDGLALSAQTTLNPQRFDIGLDGLLAFEISDVLTADECDAMVAATEQLGYRDEAPGIQTPPGMRMNKSVHWIAPALMMEEIYRRIAPLLPQAIDARGLAPRLSQRLNMYRYDAGDVFNRHIDGDWPGYGLSGAANDAAAHMVEWPGSRSMLTMILYLNGADDGVVGGQTRLFSPSGTVVDITPSKGSALFFRHGFGRHSVVHEGSRVTGTAAKYVARINVMYAP